MQPNQPSPGLDILSCGDGHTEIRFEGDAAEEERAARIVADMLRRGYALFIHGDKEGELIRVKAFDAAKKCYVIAAGPEDAAAQAYSAPAPLEASVAAMAHEAANETPAPKRGRGRPPRKSVPMASVRVTAVGRSAGG